MKQENMVQKIRSFWNGQPCGATTTNKNEGTLEFFEEAERYRYCEESHLLEISEFTKWSGKKVLEIGCGLGTDIKQFAQNEAIVTGVDLTPQSIELVKKRFSLYGLKGEFINVDARRLPFADNSFDLVYSCGVLHHIPEVKKVVAEIKRVLNPGGKIIILLYNKHSLHYYWYTLIFTGIFKLGFLRYSLQDMIAMCTDGVGNPYSKLYTKADARELFAGFDNIKIDIRHLSHISIFAPFGKYITRNRLPKFIIKILEPLGRQIGWYLVIKGNKSNQA